VIPPGRPSRGGGTAASGASWALALTLLVPAASRGQETGRGYEAEETNSSEAEKAEPSELTLLNFFTEGWNQESVKRSRRGRAPDMALLRVTTNFVDRKLRLDYAYTRGVKNSTKVDHIQFLNGLMDYGVNRRLMLEITSNYQWNEPPSGSTASRANGAGAAALARFQLVDSYGSSFAFQARVSAPNRGIGQTATTISTALAGFQDLQVFLGLSRLGLYESVTYDSLVGPVAAGARTQAVSYDVSLARSWTQPDLYPIGNLSSFLELFATTDLDGDTRYHTGVTLTPGFRFWFAHNNSLLLGMDVPVSHPHQFEEAFRITYILTF
jgi:hypothetical protein